MDTHTFAADGSLDLSQPSHSSFQEPPPTQSVAVPGLPPPFATTVALPGQHSVITTCTASFGNVGETTVTRVQRVGMQSASPCTALMFNLTVDLPLKKTR